MSSTSGAVDSGFTAELAQRVSGLRFADLPEDMVERSRQCLLDWLGVAVAGSVEPTARLLVDELLDLSGARDATGVGFGGAGIVGRRIRLGAADAALANGTAGHALDYDDVNNAMIGHPSAPVLPAALALAEHLGSSGADVLTAFVAGYEAECCVGRALGVDHYQRGFHATGTAGTLGAAAACARLLGLDAPRTALALGLASTQAAGLKSMFGTMAKPLHAGRAASAGLLAAGLAGRGFSAHPAAVETEQGLAATHTSGFDPDRGLAPPPRGWHLRNNLFKYHASCFQTHSSIEGLVRLRQAEGIQAPEVRSVTIHADTMQMGMCAIPEPLTGLEVKFSLRHTAAFALAGVDSSAPASFTDAAATDPELVQLRGRIQVVPDGEPGRPTRVEVRLGDGRCFEAAHDVSIPEHDLGLQGRRLEDKFLSLTGPLLGYERSRRLLAAVAEVDRSPAVRALLDLAQPA